MVKLVWLCGLRRLKRILCTGVVGSAEVGGTVGGFSDIVAVV